MLHSFIHLLYNVLIFYSASYLTGIFSHLKLCLADPTLAFKFVSNEQNVSSPLTRKRFNILGSLRDHPQKVLLAQFSLYVHKCGLKPNKRRSTILKTDI